MATEAEIQTELSKVRETVKHKMNVLDACITLGERLIEEGEISIGRELIAKGFEHDLSKFEGIEHRFLTNTDDEDKDNIALAVWQHNHVNLHHPEAWGVKGIKLMPRIFLAELVCDWRARSVEFGSSLVDWIEKDAKKRFKFSKRDKCYEDIMYFVSLLLKKPFEELPKNE